MQRPLFPPSLAIIRRQRHHRRRPGKVRSIHPPILELIVRLHRLTSPHCPVLVPMTMPSEMNERRYDAHRAGTIDAGMEMNWEQRAPHRAGVTISHAHTRPVKTTPHGPRQPVGPVEHKTQKQKQIGSGDGRVPVLPPFVAWAARWPAPFICTARDHFSPRHPCHLHSVSCTSSAQRSSGIRNTNCEERNADCETPSMQSPACCIEARPIYLPGRGCRSQLAGWLRMSASLTCPTSLAAERNRRDVPSTSVSSPLSLARCQPTLVFTDHHRTAISFLTLSHSLVLKPTPQPRQAPLFLPPPLLFPFRPSHR